MRKGVSERKRVNERDKEERDRDRYFVCEKVKDRERERLIE